MSNKLVTLQTIADGGGPRLQVAADDGARRVFGDIVDDHLVLALVPFIESGHLSYWCPKALKQALHLLDQQADYVSDLLRRNRGWLDHALQALCRWRTDSDEMDQIKTAHPDSLTVLEDDILPGYLRLVEYIYEPLTDFLIRLHKAPKAKGPPALPDRPLWFNNHSMPALSNGYDSFLRNSVAHGGWRFVDDMVEILDGNISTQVSTKEILLKLHSLRRTCNAILLALVIHCGQRHSNTPELLPSLGQFLLNGGNDTFWRIRRVHEVEGELLKLHIEAVVTDPSIAHVSTSAVKIAVRADKLFGHRFDRINLTIDTGANVQASAFISTEKLRSYRDVELEPEIWNEVVQFLPFGTKQESRGKFGFLLEGARRALSTRHEVVGKEFRKQGLAVAFDAYELWISNWDWAEDGASVIAFVTLRPHIELSHKQIETVAKSAIRKLRGEKRKGFELGYSPDRKPVSPSNIRLFLFQKKQPHWLLNQARFSFLRNLVATALWHKTPTKRKFSYSWERAKRLKGFAVTHLYSESALNQLNRCRPLPEDISSQSASARGVDENGHDAPIGSTLKRTYVVSPSVTEVELRHLLQVAVSKARKSEGFVWRDHPDRVEIRIGYDETDLNDDIWGWVGRALWTEKSDEIDLEIRSGSSSVDNVDYFSKALGLPITFFKDDKVALEIAPPHPSEDAFDVLYVVDAAVKQLARASEFTLIANGKSWATFTRQQWHCADVSRSSNSTFERVLRGQKVEVGEVAKRLKNKGAKFAVS